MNALQCSRCPRCGGDVHCGAAAVAAAGAAAVVPCACAGVALSPALQAGLRARFNGCLCLACLRAVAGGGSVAPAAEPQTEFR